VLADNETEALVDFEAVGDSVVEAEADGLEEGVPQLGLVIVPLWSTTRMILYNVVPVV